VCGGREVRNCVLPDEGTGGRMPGPPALLAPALRACREHPPFVRDFPCRPGAQPARRAKTTAPRPRRPPIVTAQSPARETIAMGESCRASGGARPRQLHVPQRPAAQAQSGRRTVVRLGPQPRTHARPAGSVRSAPPGQQRRTSLSSARVSPPSGLAAERMSAANSARSGLPWRSIRT